MTQVHCQFLSPRTQRWGLKNLHVTVTSAASQETQTEATQPNEPDAADAELDGSLALLGARAQRTGSTDAEKPSVKGATHLPNFLVNSGTGGANRDVRRGTYRRFSEGPSTHIHALREY